MSRQQSEGEVHVEAMRLILAEMERREDVPDWTIWQHMLNMLETIFQGIEDQRDDDRDELMHTRKDRDHWRQARQEAIEAGELMRAEIETLRKQLSDAQRAVSDAFAEVNSVREQLDAANAAVTLQRAGIERLQAFIGKIRHAQNNYQWPASWNEITAALSELDGEPTPATEPTTCPECERLRAFANLSRRLLSVNINYADVDRLRAGLAELDAGTEPTPVAEPVDAEGGQ